MLDSNIVWSRYAPPPSLLRRPSSVAPPPSSTLLLIQLFGSRLKFGTKFVILVQPNCEDIWYRPLITNLPRAEEIANRSSLAEQDDGLPALPELDVEEMRQRGRPKERKRKRLGWVLNTQVGKIIAPSWCFWVGEFPADVIYWRSEHQKFGKSTSFWVTILSDQSF